MNIEADIMADMVWEQCVYRVAGHVKAEILQTVRERVTGRLVQFIERKVGAGAAEPNAGALDVEEEGIQVFLGGREFATNRPGARYVCDVTAVLRAGINEDEVVRLERHVIRDVM